MKKVFLSIIVAASVLTGCADAYEAEQPTYRTDENVVFANASEIARGVFGLYSNFNIESEINFVSYFTDECGVGVTNAGQGVNDGSYTFQLTPATSFATSHWGTNMNLVNRANRMLARIVTLTSEINSSTTLTASQKAEQLASLDGSKANLLAFRAYAHYRMFAYYTPNYTNGSGPSIIKFDFLQTDDYNRTEARSTVNEIVAFIEKDIAEARSLGISNSADNTEITESFLDAILVKLYSMTENYSGLQAAFDRLNAKHSIGSGLDYLTTFADDAAAKASNPDIILRLERKINQGGGVAGAWYSNRVGINSSMIYMEMGRSLYNELDKLDPTYTGTAEIESRSDVRYLVNVLSGSKIATNYKTLTQDVYKTNDVLLIGKYPGRTAALLQNDVYAFRFTDMLLALAEKHAAEGKFTGDHTIGNFDSVESIIFNIRAARNIAGANEPVAMPTNFSSRQQAYARILEERRIEFAFEGTRYLDMRRLGVKAGSPGYVRDAMDCASTNACHLETSSYKMVLPIPSTEMISNNKMTQNPGY